MYCLTDALLVTYELILHLYVLAKSEAVRPRWLNICRLRGEFGPGWVRRQAVRGISCCFLLFSSLQQVSERSSAGWAQWD